MSKRTKFRRVAPFFCSILVWAFPSPAHAVPGPQFEGIDGYISYFLATSGLDEDEKYDDKSCSDFTDCDKSLDDSINRSNGSAQSRVRQMTHLGLGPGGPVDGTTVHNLHSIGKTSGRAIATSEENGVPVADGEADLSFDFSIVDVPTPYVINASTIVDNNDSDDCSEAYVELANGESFYRKYRRDGGDCGSPNATSGAASGILPVGSYTLEANAYGGVAADWDSAHFSSEYTVSLWLFPPCDVEGTDAGEALQGTGGDDVICAEGGNDEIDGRGGNDTILTGKGSDEVNAGGGNDDVFGAEGNDDINGGDGKDLLLGDIGNDNLDGGAGDDGDFSGGVIPTAGIFGDVGDDKGDGGGGRDFIDGGPNDDVFFGSDGRDALAGGLGGDRLIAGGDNDLVAGGDSADILNGGGGADDILGQAGADKSEGGPGDDEMMAGTQDDEFAGNDGEDKILGGPGGDDITGGGDKDILKGEEDNDKILAKDGQRDTVSGGPGGNDKAERDGIDDVSGIEQFI